MSLLEDILSGQLLSRVRRNHGLEHATLNILSRQYPQTNLAGHSDNDGFWIVGNLPTEVVEAAARQGLERITAGEQGLVIHANCGTNFVAAGAAAGLAAWIGMLGSGRRMTQKLERLPLVISMATVALILAQPLGFILQARVTTSSQPGGLRIVRVFPNMQGQIKTHRVLTQG